MVVKRRVVVERLKELDTILQELRRHQSITVEEMASNLSQRWIVERGLIAAAALILDVADHILAGHFGVHPTSYEESLVALRNKQVISAEVYEEIKGLGGFRNVLVHLYQSVDLRLLREGLQKGIVVFPRFSQEVLAWLDRQATANNG